MLFPSSDAGDVVADFLDHLLPGSAGRPRPVLRCPLDLLFPGNAEQSAHPIVLAPWSMASTSVASSVIALAPTGASRPRGFAWPRRVSHPAACCLACLGERITNTRSSCHLAPCAQARSHHSLRARPLVTTVIGAAHPFQLTGPPCAPCGDQASMASAVAG